MVDLSSKPPNPDYVEIHLSGEHNRLVYGINSGVVTSYINKSMVLEVSS